MASARPKRRSRDWSSTCPVAARRHRTRRVRDLVLARPEPSLSAVRGHEGFIRTHIVPALGNVRVARLRTAQLDHLYSRIKSRLFRVRPLPDNAWRCSLPATPPISLPSRSGYCQVVARHPSKHRANMGAETAGTVGAVRNHRWWTEGSMGSPPSSRSAKFGARRERPARRSGRVRRQAPGGTQNAAKAGTHPISPGSAQ